MLTDGRTNEQTNRRTEIWTPISHPAISRCDKKSIHTHTAFFSENLKFSTVDSILTNIMVYFEDNTNKKKKTAALLLYTQLEHDKIILQEQHHLLQVFVYYYVVFRAALCFLSSRAATSTTAVFDKRVFYLHLL